MKKKRRYLLGELIKTHTRTHFCLNSLLSLFEQWSSVANTDAAAFAFLCGHTQKWLAFPLLLRRRVLRIPIVITDILIHLINNKEEEEEEVVPRRRRRAALCEARRHPHPHQTRIIRTKQQQQQQRGHAILLLIVIESELVLVLVIQRREK